ncbi:MAG: MerR family transcriptional regulator [Anaerolineaceae bacterium]|nr:MerR family transcriptional regulator [Anaerolineaceae bacterium]
MLIKEIADRVGVSIDTIRFYEKQGLLDETHFERTANGYRHYSEGALQRLQLIKMGQLIGFTLSEMREAIQAWETDELTPHEKEYYLCRKLEEICQKIDAMNEMKAFLQIKIQELHKQAT